MLDIKRREFIALVGGGLLLAIKVKRARRPGLGHVRLRLKRNDVLNRSCG